MKNQGFSLRLNDEIVLSIFAKDKKSKEIINFFADATQLKPDDQKTAQSKKRIFVLSNENELLSSKKDNASIINIDSNDSYLKLEPETIYRFPPREPDKNSSDHPDPGKMTRDEWRWRQLTRLSSVVGGYTLLNGGFLIHSGLAGFNFKNSNKGVILSGASGSGKTSASRLLKSPWFSLSDDLTIITKNSDNSYSAHPLPTWSSFFGKKLSVSIKKWNIEKSIPISTIVFFDRGDNSKIKRTGPARSLCLLTELAKQANEFLINGLDKKTILNFNKNMFLNIYEFIKSIPGYTLNLDLNKKFWEEMETIPKINPDFPVKK